LAPNGREAIDLYQEHSERIALVLLDVRMPGLDGPETLEALRKINPAGRRPSRQSAASTSTRKFEILDSWENRFPDQFFVRKYTAAQVHRGFGFVGKFKGLGKERVEALLLQLAIVSISSKKTTRLFELAAEEQRGERGRFEDDGAGT